MCILGFYRLFILFILVLGHLVTELEVVSECFPSTPSRKKTHTPEGPIHVFGSLCTVQALVRAYSMSGTAQTLSPPSGPLNLSWRERSEGENYR